MKIACLAQGIERSGSKGWVITHGLTGTLVTILFKSGHADSSAFSGIGHRDPKSLQSYQLLHGGEGLQQQRNILGDSEQPSKCSHCGVDFCAGWNFWSCCQSGADLTVSTPDPSSGTALTKDDFQIFLT